MNNDIAAELVLLAKKVLDTSWNPIVKNIVINRLAHLYVIVMNNMTQDNRLPFENNKYLQHGTTKRKNQ